MTNTSNQNSKQSSETLKNQYWGEGFLIGKKTVYHPYTHKDFKFDLKR